MYEMLSNWSLVENTILKMLASFQFPWKLVIKNSKDVASFNHLQPTL